ncbi:MAG: hypothetical protein Q4C25_00275 [Bacillota bacterium]|nr:hypothetical protein [Bacillota bacterium]
MKQEKERYRTKYPILLVHGLGYRDDRGDKYWGRIPQLLRDLGNQIYFGHQDGYGSMADNADALKKRVLVIAEETGVQRVNIIAHSKGGLEARYMISQLGMADHVASLTTMSTPHKGSPLMDKIASAPRPLKGIFGACVNGVQRIKGDRHPNAIKSIEELSQDYVGVFNEMMEDSEKVYYQSYAFYMKGPFDDLLLTAPYRLYRRLHRERDVDIPGMGDGLVTADSARWGEFKGVYTSYGKRGISHRGATDTFRRPFVKSIKIAETAEAAETAGKEPEEDLSKTDDHVLMVEDIADLYLEIVEDLALRGF